MADVTDALTPSPRSRIHKVGYPRRPELNPAVTNILTDLSHVVSVTLSTISPSGLSPPLPVYSTG